MAHNDEFDELKVRNEPEEPEDVIRQMEIDSLENTLEGWADDPHGNESHSDVYLTADDINGEETVNTAPSPHNNDHHAEPYATQSSVDSLQTDIDGAADDPHDNTAHSEDYATDPHGDGSHTEDYAVDGDAQPPEAHDNMAHSEDYATETSLAGVLTDVDGKADDPHDNTAHSENYAVDGDAQPPESHDNTAHSEAYAVDGDPQPPEGHDNSAHTEAYATESDVAGKADAQGGSIGDETPLDSLHSESVETKQVTYENEPQSGVAGVGPSDYPTQYTDYNAGLHIRPRHDRELRLTEATIDAQSAGDLTIGLWEYDGDAGRGTQLDSTVVSVDSGLQTITLDLLIPGGGDYYLGKDVNAGSPPQLTVIPQVGDIFPIESDILTVVGGATPEAFSGPHNNYYSFFDIGVEESGTATSSVSVNGGGVLELDAVETNQHNHVHYAPPGELASVMESVSDGDRVHLYPNETYITTEEIVVPRDVRLIGNGATVKPDSDHNVFFLEPNCHIKHLNIRVGEVSFTSKAIEINTERLNDVYHGGTGGTVIWDVNIGGSSDNMSGDGVYIRVGDNQWYSANQHHQFAVSGLGNGLHVDVDSQGHANGNIFKCSLWNNGTQLRHSGNGPFESQIISELDASDNGAGTEHMIVNEPSTGRTCMVYGKMYDPFNCSGDYLVGTINMQHHGRPHVSVIPNSPNASGLITSQDRQEMLVVDLGAGVTWRQEYYESNTWLRFQVDTDGGRDFSDIMSFRPLDSQIRMHPELVVSSVNEVG